MELTAACDGSTEALETDHIVKIGLNGNRSTGCSRKLDGPAPAPLEWSGEPGYVHARPSETEPAYPIEVTVVVRRGLRRGPGHEVTPRPGTRR